MTAPEIDSVDGIKIGGVLLKDNNAGDATHKLDEIWAVDGIFGDLMFEERECHICGEPFNEGEILSLVVVKTAENGTVTNLYTWNHNAGGTGAWVSVDVTPSHSVLPNQGILINNMGAPYNWDGAVN